MAESPRAADTTGAARWPDPLRPGRRAGVENPSGCAARPPPHRM